MLKLFNSIDDVRLYDWEQESNIRCIIATSPQTRSICNDPRVLGTDYTSLLKQACAGILKAGDFKLTENNTAVINILRGGLNFGLREALSEAFGWKAHTTCFISAQRARDTADPEEWHITENAYRKVYFPADARLVIGDVVATDTSLKYALGELVKSALNENVALKSILFFTYGGYKALDILKEVDAQCRQNFSDYESTTLVFLEGCFLVPDLHSKLSIRLTGTDLLRGGSEMAPEFIESQYEDPAYPLERCTIYDAGSRAFWVREYANDVLNYWKQVLDLAASGVTFLEYLEQRFPELDASRFPEGITLKELALRQINRMQPYAL